jgi:3-deoxy-D-manno-octulosonate 8-phosphate phosphatase (KDO 8-P phosphatase)
MPLPNGSFNIRRKMPNYKVLLKNITTFIFDYDGVLTDGSVIMMPDGEALRISNIKDGYALQLAVKYGYNVAIISGASSGSMIKRLEALKIRDYYLGISNKIETLKTYLAEKNLDPSQVVYMGDDIPDYEVMKAVGLAACPADAAEEIRKISAYISSFPGGKGCARDIIEQVMKVQGKWMNHDAFYW